HWLAKVSVDGLSVRWNVSAARLRVHQDGLDHSSHISTHARTVVVERCGNSADVRRAGIAADQVKDQLPGDEWSHIGMVEDVLQSPVEILLRRLSGGQRYVV